MKLLFCNNNIKWKKCILKKNFIKTKKTIYNI